MAGAAELIGDERADPRARTAAALDPALLEAARPYPDRGEETRSAVVELEVERERARFGSWYELFPRSWGGFAGVQRQLPRFAELGFDVLYLPPIHPIGVTRRKGRDDAPEAAPGDPGSPWAIGSTAGGHCAVHPELGTLEDFDRLVADAGAHGIEIALDYALQCSADHPWLREHPEWFRHRPDGTLKYAENPPKRYMDIYNFDFDSPRLALAVGGPARRDAVLDRARRQRSSGSTTPHQAPGLLGVADRVRPRGSSRDGFPIGGVHALGHDGGPRKGRLQPVLHILHLEELAATSCASTSKS